MVQTFYFLVLFLGLLSRNSYATVSDNTAYAITLFSPGFVTLAAIFRNEIADSRIDKYFLIERNYSASKGDGYTAGFYLNQDLIAFSRFSIEGRPLADFESDKIELGLRMFFKSFFGEFGIFSAEHQTRDFYFNASRTAVIANSSQYQTVGMLLSLAASIQVWRVSAGFRGTYFRGLSTRMISRSSDASELTAGIEKESRDTYRSIGNLFLDFGVSF